MGWSSILGRGRTPLYLDTPFDPVCVVSGGYARARQIRVGETTETVHRY